MLQMIKRNKRQFAELLVEIGFLSSADPTDPSSNINSSELSCLARFNKEFPRKRFLSNVLFKIFS